MVVTDFDCSVVTNFGYTSFIDSNMHCIIDNDITFAFKWGYII